MPKGNESTTKFKADISELKKAMQDAKRSVSVANSEFKAISSSMDDWTKSSDGLTAKLNQLDSNLKSQKTILSSLEEQYELTVKEMGEGSAAADRLKIAINNQKAVVNKTEKEIADYEQSLAEVSAAEKEAAKTGKTVEEVLDDIGDAAKETEGEVGGLKGKLADLAKNGMAAVATAAVGMLTAFLGSAEATREYRTNMSKLQAAFQTAGFEAKTATQTYKDFYAILGDEGQATEAVNHLAELCDTEKELADWTTIATGVYAKFGDSLPIEGLTEAANETAKVGQVTGPLADALNWVGISEDEFNEKLAACNSEQERAALITSTLTGEYSDIAAKYQELNGDIMDAQKAQAELNDAMAQVGAAAEPVMTSIKLFGASLLTELLPGITQVSDALMGLVKGEEGAGEALGGALSKLIVDALNKVIELLPQVATIGISLITSIVEGILQAMPSAINAAIDIVYRIIDGLILAIPQLLQASITFFSTMAEALPGITDKVLELLLEMVYDLVYGLLDAMPKLLDGAMKFFSAILQAIPEIIPMLLEMIPLIIEAVVDFILGAVPLLLDASISLLMAIVDAIPQVITALVDSLPQIITAIITAVVTALPELLNAAITLFMAIVQAIPQIVVALAEALPQIIDAITDTLLDNLPLLLECAVTLFMALVDAIPQIVVELVKAVIGIVTSIMESLSTILPKLLKFSQDIRKKVLTFFSDLIRTGASKAGEFITKIITKVKELPGKMQTQFSNAIAKATAFFSDILSKAKTKTKEFVDKITDKLKELPGEMWKKFTSAIQKVVDLGVKLKEKAKDAGQKLIDGIKEKIKGLPDDIKTIGQNVAEGLWNGINNKVEWLKGKIKSFVGDVTGWLKKFFGIKSPSRVMRDQVGKWLPEGIAVGISENAKTAIKAMKDLASDMASPLNFDIPSVNTRIAGNMGRTGNGVGNNSTNNTTYTFNQYNNSPKALSKLEIYRQTKNQLAFAKGV